MLLTNHSGRSHALIIIVLLQEQSLQDLSGISPGSEALNVSVSGSDFSFPKQKRYTPDTRKPDEGKDHSADR